MVKSSQNIIAIIPARGGSKRIRNKNLTPINGLPLLAYSILSARHAKSVSRVFVSTEDAKIAKVAKQYGAEVIKRPQKLASDKATSESALLHVLDFLKAKGEKDPDLVVFLQATSPLRAGNDIDNAVAILQKKKADSLVSVCRDKGLMWMEQKGKVRSINYDFQTRKREQDMGIQYRENGSIYVFKPAVLRKNNNRLGGKIAVYEMDLAHSFQIDEPDDVKFIENLQILTKPADSAPLPGKVKLVVFDFDGVFTDNTVKTSLGRHESVTTSRTDSLGLDYLRRANIPAIVLSTEKHGVVAERCEKLKLECHQGVGNKRAYLASYLKGRKIDPSEVVYIGNDLNDLACFQFVGFAAAPADSHPEIIKAAHFVSRFRGGKGAVREICELIIKAHDKSER